MISLVVVALAPFSFQDLPAYHPPAKGCVGSGMKTTNPTYTLPGGAKRSLIRLSDFQRAPSLL